MENGQNNREVLRSLSGYVESARQYLFDNVSIEGESVNLTQEQIKELSERRLDLERSLKVNCGVEDEEIRNSYGESFLLMSVYDYAKMAVMTHYDGHPDVYSMPQAISMCLDRMNDILRDVGISQETAKDFYQKQFSTLEEMLS